MKPPFDMQSYFRAVFEERWDCVANDGPDDLADMKGHLENAETLSDWCEEMLSCFTLDKILLGAMMNSVNWEELRCHLLEHVGDAEDAQDAEE